MTELQFFAAEIDEWKRSQKRKEQITGDATMKAFMTFFRESALSLVRMANFRKLIIFLTTNWLIISLL
jgi:hypothetical protein